MAKLTIEKRKKLPAKKFSLEKERKYPINDRAHAANAKARATQMYNKGKLSKSKMEEVHREANAVLKKTARI
jgi:hypothetical protein